MTLAQAGSRARKLQRQGTHVLYEDQGSAYGGRHKCVNTGVDLDINAKGEFHCADRRFVFWVDAGHCVSKLYNGAGDMIMQAHRPAPWHKWQLDFLGTYRRQIPEFVGDLRDQLVPTIQAYVSND